MPADDQKMLSQPCREKYWNERDREEKLEALRQQTIQLSRMVSEVMDTVHALLQHQHAASGALMAPMDGRNGYVPYAERSRHIPTSLNIDPQLQQQGPIHAR